MLFVVCGLTMVNKLIKFLFCSVKTIVITDIMYMLKQISLVKC